MLKNKFYRLCQQFSMDNQLIHILWKELKIAYSDPKRHYHTLTHIESIYKEFETLELTPILEFAIFYHDFIYDIKEKDNEEQSALVAIKSLKKLNINEKLILNVFNLIRESKYHQSNHSRNILFLDADLAMLGSTHHVYLNYTKQIREEYIDYSNHIYNKGRKEILKFLLKKERIYHSNFFYNKYEKQAQENILKEYNSLLI